MSLKGKYCTKALEVRYLSESERQNCPGVLATVVETTVLLDHKPDRKRILGRYHLEAGSIPAESSVFALLPGPGEKFDSWGSDSQGAS